MKPYAKAFSCALVVSACSCIGNAAAEQGLFVICRSGATTNVAKTEDTVIYTVDHRGVILSEEPTKFLDNFTQRCVGSISVINGKQSGQGFCRNVDPATGDLVLVAWTAVGKPGSGTYTYIGGTGKWKGISGSGEYQLVAPTRPADEGTYQNCIRNKDTHTLLGK